MLTTLVVVLGLLSADAHAEPLGSRIGWEEALERARRTPGVSAAGRAANEKRALDESVGGLGNPEVGLAAGVRKGEPDSGFEGEVSIVQPIPLSSLGAERRTAARAETKVLDVQARALRLQRSLEVAEAWVLLHATQRVLEETEAAVALADEFLDGVERGSRAGIFTADEVASARAHAARARLARLDAEGEAFDRGVELARLTLHPGPLPLRTDGPLPHADLPPAMEWADRLRPERLPPVLVPILQAEAARARLREQEVAGRTIWLGVGAAAIREAEERALVGTLSFGLPLFERNQRERGQLLAEARAEEGRGEEARATAHTLASSLIHEVEHTEEVFRLVNDLLLPSAEERLRLIRLSFQVGETTILEVRQAQEELLDVRIRLHRAQAARALARLRLAFFLEAVP